MNMSVGGASAYHPIQTARPTSATRAQIQQMTMPRGGASMMNGPEVQMLMKHAQMSKGMGIGKGMPPCVLPEGAMMQKAQKSNASFMKSMALKIGGEMLMAVAHAM